MLCLQNSKYLTKIYAIPDPSKYLTFLKQLEWGQASIMENGIMVADLLKVSHLKKEVI